ncbi:cytidine deaminase [Eubacteriales bacterium OttesenSCG-928-N13]|nr:cytidine deaminase [Eubacteriales bacterium OttesenSCG-928-N13]
MTDQQLFQCACEALKMAYTPYSHFNVGACILATDGRTFQGCNVENASYGATICAERTAVVTAVTQGAQAFSAIAVVGEDAPAWPCGVCRQVLNEFSADMRVICGAAKTGEYQVVKLSELLPHSFGPHDLQQ